MGKSFVMKRPDGSLAGYLVQGDGKICFRAHALPEDGAELTLVFSDGAGESRAISGEREIVWPDRGKNAEAAFVAKGERLIMSTGEQGRRAFKAALERAEAKRRTAARRASRTPPPRPENEPDGGAEQCLQEAENPAEPSAGPNGLRDAEAGRAASEETEHAAQASQPLQEARKDAEDAPFQDAAPERRWPPPPCAPKARYEEGRWRM
ncbi:MAG: hypothetical protein Q4G52_06685 [Clostridia bacterium]|nr:hypothetical protein [Clostridia bacterium]